MTDDEYDAELLIEYATWLGREIPNRIDLGMPASAREDGSLAADNEAAWRIATADPRWPKLGEQASHSNRGKS